MPGGGQRTDELLQDTVKRECEEELRIKVEPKSLKFIVEGLRGESFHRVDLVFLCDYIGEIENARIHKDKNQIGFERISNNTFIDKYTAYKKSIRPEMIRPFPFAEEVCRKFVTLGGRNYIITHRGDTTIKFLEHYGMKCDFTEIITKKYGFRRKPDPEAFIYLIEKYQINKRIALVIGDRECEVLGGKAAGIRTCLYNTNNISFDTKPDFYIDSLKNLVDIIY